MTKEMSVKKGVWIGLVLSVLIALILLYTDHRAIITGDEHYFNEALNVVAWVFAVMIMRLGLIAFPEWRSGNAVVAATFLVVASLLISGMVHWNYLPYLVSPKQ